MSTKIQIINTYLYNHKNELIVVLFIGMISLLVQEIPFFNLRFPPSAPIVVVLVSLVVFLNIFRSPLFLLGFLCLTIALYFIQLPDQAEQAANLLLILLLVLVLSNVASLYESIK